MKQGGLELEAVSVQGTESDFVDFLAEKMNQDLDCAGIPISIKKSEFIHSFAALYFLFATSVCNIYYVIAVWDRNGYKLFHTGGGVFIVILAILNLIVLPTFIAVQGMIFMEWTKIWNMPTLNMISFTFECLSGLIVIVLAVVGSMRRNRDVDWFE